MSFFAADNSFSACTVCRCFLVLLRKMWVQLVATFILFPFSSVFVDDFVGLLTAENSYYFMFLCIPRRLYQNLGAIKEKPLPVTEL